MSKEVKVGIFSVIAIATLYLGFNYLKGIDFFTRSHKYYVLYEDVGGLSKSNPVEISGFSVGKVSNITLLQDQGNIVLVEMDIDNRIILGDSAVARLDADLLGGVSIVIGVGNVTRPISPGDTLYARVEPGLTEFFMESAQPLTDNLPVLISNLNILLEELRGSGEGLKKAMESFTSTSNMLNYTLRENKGDIRDIVSEFKILSKKLNTTVDEIPPLLESFSGVADSLNNIGLSATVARLNLLLDDTADLINSISDNDGTLGKLMKEDSLYQNINKAMLDLDSLLIHMNENPKHFFAPLGKSRKKIEKDLAKQ
jgi:phospholipid/cholesterol/gamma-HCH transport system substrate-binding protein